jgi:hypothetical protein
MYSMQQYAEHRTPTWQVAYFSKVIENRIKCRRYYVHVRAPVLSNRRRKKSAKFFKNGVDSARPIGYSDSRLIDELMN